MKTVTLLSALIAMCTVAACSSTPGRSSSPATLSHDQVEQKRTVLFYEKGSDTPYTGAVVDYYGSGEKKLSMRIENGLLTGNQVSWYRNGQKAKHANVNSSETGHVAEWFEDGQMKMESNVVNGRVDGISTMWYPNGQKRSEENYRVEGRPTDGTATKWYENGQMQEETRWVNGQTVCTRKWDRSGQKEEWGRRCIILPKDQINIGILPFSVRTESADAELAAENLTKSFILDLESQGYKVAPGEQTATISIRDQGDRELIQSLGITHLLSGSLWLRDNRLTLIMNLRSTDSGHIWTQNYFPSIADYSGVQSNIVTRIVDALITQ